MSRSNERPQPGAAYKTLAPPPPGARRDLAEKEEFCEEGSLAVLGPQSLCRSHSPPPSNAPDRLQKLKVILCFVLF